MRRFVAGTFLDEVPLASASVAQVHFAELPDGTPVAVKVLRPGIERIIDKDVGLMHAGAMLVEKLWADGKRLRPREVVAEFARHLDDELDLMREAANAAQLKRNFTGSPLLYVPEVYFDLCTVNVMVMGPGGYTFRDYVRTGLPLVGTTLLAVLITLPVFWGVH